ncbi:hypothetical protein BDDG_03753 [Blastomyces dermatitidis ATCC 18188]|uniref:Uncharacterized protein n=1 Tax=Ajellomyces dermatitidis (strain ATCC 18188 / CBS 674.68) TaxID=653446 RepID=F2TC49_AJEDA|nr:hypothetical protein BDDG_03753 [Blastomyces dermatitidis ATCC 18188]
MAHCERGVCEGFAVHSRKLSKLLEPGCAQHNSYWMTGVITNNSEAGSHCLAERRVVLSISLVTRIASRKRELSSQEGQHEGRLPRLNCKRAPGCHFRGNFVACCGFAGEAPGANRAVKRLAGISNSVVA